MTVSEGSAFDGLAAAARTHRDRLLAGADRIAAAHGLLGPAEALTAGPTVGTLGVEVELVIGVTAIGEVVVTTATAVLDGRPGWSCVLGADEDAATAAALCDALLTGGDPALGSGGPTGDPAGTSVLHEVAALIQAALAQERAGRATERARATATRLGAS